MTTIQKHSDTVSTDQAKAILQFLQRTQMQGAEMPVYVDIFNCLSAIIAEERPLKDSDASSKSNSLG